MSEAETTNLGAAPPQEFRALRIFLALDAAVLMLLGVFFLFAPGRALEIFGFQDIPDSMHYIIGLWGCVFATLGWGYLAAAADPLRNILWIQVGIARGVAECLFGAACIFRGIISPGQSAFGIVVAGLLAVSYVVLYPRVKR